MVVSNTIESVALPNKRNHDHFNIGNAIRLYIADESIGPAGWYRASVRNGYRHHDGCVSYCIEGVGPQDEGFWGCGMAVPHILLEEEYQFFKHHPDIYYEWCQVAYDKSFNGVYLDIAIILGTERVFAKKYLENM